MQIHLCAPVLPSEAPCLFLNMTLSLLSLFSSSFLLEITSLSSPMSCQDLVLMLGAGEVMTAGMPTSAGSVALHLGSLKACSSLAAIPEGLAGLHLQGKVNLKVSFSVGEEEGIGSTKQSYS